VIEERYRKLIAQGITTKANLSDLNDLTDRSRDPRRPPLKPWTAAKTVGTIALIKEYNIQDEVTFVRLFQQHSKISLEKLTEQVYNHQLSYFGSYKYNRDTIFKYTYCCVVLNSLKGSSCERKFDKWALRKGISLKDPYDILDQKFHTDRLQVNNKGETIAFISIKPNSFFNNYLQYTDVFGGLQALNNHSGIPWKIFYEEGNEFKLISLEMEREETQAKIREWALIYSTEELSKIKNIFNNL